MSQERVVCVVMAVFKPDQSYLRAQLQSIVEQTLRPQVFVAICSDCVSKPLVEKLMGQVGLDVPTVVVQNTGSTCDAVRAFEQGLEIALDQTRDFEDAYIALCDQDDVWFSDRLKQGADALDGRPRAQLTHCDAHVVDAAGDVLHGSMFEYEKRHRAPGLRGLLYRNTVTGMTVMMRRAMVDFALPFPPQSGVQFYHDLWLALCAESRGGVVRLDQPLVAYRQHGGNAIGAVDRTTTAGGLRTAGRRIRGVIRDRASWLRRETGGYGVARYLAVSLRQRFEDRCGPGDGQAALKPIRAYLRKGGFGGRHFADSLGLAVTGKMALARIAWGHGIVGLGRLVWGAKQALDPGLSHALGQFDARLYDLSVGVQPQQAISVDTESNAVGDFLDLRKTPSWTPRFDAEVPHLTLLVPSLNPTEAFAGIATAIDMGVGFAARGHKVRFIATDAPVISLASSERFILGRVGADTDRSKAAANISVNCGVLGDGVSGDVTVTSHKNDRFFVTAWWTAHVAQDLIERFGYQADPMIYLIQDFEPNFYPWGSEFADAMASYDMPFVPIFNTSLLQAYFADQGFAFAQGDTQLVVRPSIDLQTYLGPRPASPNRRRLAIYGRPEVARNMFATMLEGVMLFLQRQDLTPDDIELLSVGLKHAPITFPGEHLLQGLGKLPFEDYPDFLRSVQFGVSLMYSPHPSHLPLEMAAAGVRVITNTFGSKDLGRLSGAIISVTPTPNDIAEALARAWTAQEVTDADRQVDLTQLGLGINEVLDVLSERLTRPTRNERIENGP